MSSNHKLFIPGTDETPEVNLSLEEGVCKMSGRSLPENAFDFYKPILDWLKDEIKSVRHQVELTLEFDYFNSSSGRYLYELLTTLERSPNKQYFSVIWNVEKDDELMLEKGEELKSLLDINFEMKLN